MNDIAVQNLCSDLTLKEMRRAIGLIKNEMILKEGENRATHFVCPITYKVLNIKGSVKIISDYKMTRTYVSKSWYYLSRKAYNKIVKRIKK